MRENYNAIVVTSYTVFTVHKIMLHKILNMSTSETSR